MYLTYTCNILAQYILNIPAWYMLGILWTNFDQATGKGNKLAPTPACEGNKVSHLTASILDRDYLTRHKRPHLIAPMKVPEESVSLPSTPLCTHHLLKWTHPHTLLMHLPSWLPWLILQLDIAGTICMIAQSGLNSCPSCKCSLNLSRSQDEETLLVDSNLKLWMISYCQHWQDMPGRADGKICSAYTCS
jgi:hypothetical protein